MGSGTIKNVKLDKRFGFIRGDDGVEYFFHTTAFQPAGDGVGFDDLKPGLLVTFDGADSSKGARAEAVRVLR